MSAPPLPAYGWCASCGGRVVDCWDFGIYEPPTGSLRYLYLLYSRCADAAHRPDHDAVLLAVEQRPRPRANA